MKKPAAWRDQTGSAVLIVIVLLMVVALLGFTAWHVHERHKKPAGSASGTTSTTPPSATDNASLQKDLNGVNSSLSQENQDNNAAGSALNDQQNEIQIPTN